MTLEELKDKALCLPLAPGVYLMHDKNDRVIYVGKAKKLKNRVSQYFQDSASHSPKTRLMVSKIHHFDVIVAASEFEALVLECSLIKRYMPKYNILLKDDKGYPYVRLDMREQYPELSMVSRIKDDGASYYGPFGSRGVTSNVISTIKKTLLLPDCNRQFPRDIDKERPCLNHHMGQCEGWCRSVMSQQAYVQRMEQAKQLLQGNYKAIAKSIREQMLSAADNLEFELAAALRNRLFSVESLGQHQLVTAGTLADTDVIGYAQSGMRACFTVLHFSGGNLLDKDYEIFPIPDEPESAVSSLMKQYYLSRGFAPSVVLLPFDISDSELFSQLLEERYGRKTRLKTPQRGDNVRLVELAVNNAMEEVLRVTSREERLGGALLRLTKMLGAESLKRIESYDISNISGTDIVASMVVFLDGKPRKGEYKRFRIQDMPGQDDYGSMRQVLHRRFTDLKNCREGFASEPDLILIDGGVNHAKVAEEVLLSLSLCYPVFGMVKDDKHRTRALVTSDGAEIQIDSDQAVFSLIGSIQEETHRFAITYHRQLRSKRLRYSELDQIPGVGPKRKQDLLKTFKSLGGIGNASVSELERVVPRDVALAVFQHFRNKEE